MSSTHEIVILGGNFGGISSAHYLLRHTIPALTAKDPSQKYHVTLISPSTHFFFKIAGPRVLISPTKIPISKVFMPIREHFATYQPSEFSFVEGKAVGVDSHFQTVKISLTDGSTRDLIYSTLIIATGAIADPLWALNDAHTLSEDAYRKVQEALPTAKTVLIAGGGAVGVESAGEIKENWPQIETTIISGDTRLLPRLNPKTSATAEKRLNNMGVFVKHGLKVVSKVKEENGKTRVNLSNGTDRVVDLYIDATGGKPNTNFLPKEWLDERGRVLTHNETLRGTGSNMEGVYAIGDAASYSAGGAIDVKFAVRPLMTSVGTDIAAQIDGSREKKPQGAGKTPKALVQLKFKPMKDTQMVPIGSQGGVFQIFGWRLPSFFVWLIKSRDFMIGHAPEIPLGADWVKA